MQLAIYKIEDESQPVCLLKEGEHSLGHGEQLDCMDKRVSQNHVTITINDSNATFTLKHPNNPCYWQCAESTCISLLTPNVPQDIMSGDKFGFFPASFWFVIKDYQPDAVAITTTTTTTALPEPILSNNIPKVSSTTDDNQPSCSSTTSAQVNLDKFLESCYTGNLKHKKMYSHAGDADCDTDPEDTHLACPDGRRCDQAATKTNEANTTNNKRKADSFEKDTDDAQTKPKKQEQADSSDEDVIEEEEEDLFFPDEDEYDSSFTDEDEDEDKDKYLYSSTDEDEDEEEDEDYWHDVHMFINSI